MGAIYEVGTGHIRWLPEERAIDILKDVGLNPDRALDPYAALHEKEHNE